MTKMLSVVYEADSNKDDAAVLMVFEENKILRAYTGEEAVDIFVKLTEDADGTSTE